jgi:hypothetical protein
VCVLVAAWDASADACTLSWHPRFSAAAGPVVQTDEAPPTVEVLRVDRGGLGLLVPCRALAVAELAVDDRYLGYLVELVEGTLPDGFDLHGYPIRADDGRIGITWFDRPIFHREVDVTFSIRAVHRDGRATKPILVRVREPGNVRPMSILAVLLSVVGGLVVLRIVRR